MLNTKLQCKCFLYLLQYRIHKQEIESDFQKEVNRVQVAKQNASKQPDLEEQMRDFLQVRHFMCHKSSRPVSLSLNMSMQVFLSKVARYGNTLLSLLTIDVLTQMLLLNKSFYNLALLCSFF